jgi:hypothetical protein
MLQQQSLLWLVLHINLHTLLLYQSVHPVIGITKARQLGLIQGDISFFTEYNIFFGETPLYVPISWALKRGGVLDKRLTN